MVSSILLCATPFFLSLILLTLVFVVVVRSEAVRSPQQINIDAIARAQSGDLRGSLELFRKLLQSDASNSEWWNNAGVTLMRLRLYHLSEVHFRRALEIDGNSDAAANVSADADGVSGEEHGNETEPTVLAVLKPTTTTPIPAERS